MPLILAEHYKLCIQMDDQTKLFLIFTEMVFVKK